MLKQAEPEYRFPSVAFFREDTTRVRFLRPEEEMLLFAMIPEPFRAIARLAALTLMRLGEVRELRREDIHLAQGDRQLPKGKARARTVVLSKAAMAILRERLACTDGEWIFPNPDGRPYTRVHVSRVFLQAVRAAGLQDFHFHDVRHHGATMALNEGFSAPIVMALGRRKTEKMMRRYETVTDPTLRRAAEAVSGAPMAPLASPVDSRSGNQVGS